ncbi:hypothetical protein GCM10009087_16640 [Sphingomonas oligophenolica]|uniref:Cytochrome P450 n=1 Tax=Sphingomonas oligophenolica TaxID=301154 RepID=A0ABU9Y801_9SPHN
MSATAACACLIARDIRGASIDPGAMGECPYAIDHDRSRCANGNGSFPSFGDGNHRCPGWRGALHETRVFVDALMRMPAFSWSVRLISAGARR